MTEQPTRLWGGRFTSGPSGAMAALSASVHFDWRLAPYDIAQTRAHVRQLAAADVLNSEDAVTLDETLAALAEEIGTGAVLANAEDEDIHTAIERMLIERLGDLGGRVRAGRSRNDQVATDFRLYAMDNAAAIRDQVLDLCTALLEQAEAHVDTLAPGFTHLQHAQPICLAHGLARHVHGLLRDVDRLADWKVRTNQSPLGAGALAGTSLALDRLAAARDLGFDGVLGNSIDAVADRDWVAEFLFATAMLGVHLSQLSEEIILMASSEFGWVQLDDAWSTGSSIMPQKKNPDVAELARGKSGRLIGNLTGLLATLKGLPFGYNRDLQEDKEPVFDTVDQLQLMLPAFTGLIATLRFNNETMERSAPQGFALATDIAEWLVRQGVPFRDAHEIAGFCVRRAEEQGIELWDLTAPDLATISPHLTAGVMTVLTSAGSVASRATAGGTAPVRVREQLAELRERISAQRAG